LSSLVALSILVGPAMGSERAVRSAQPKLNLVLVALKSDPTSVANDFSDFAANQLTMMSRRLNRKRKTNFARGP